ncbi:putative RNA recognition motif domain, nucleotide-binding alpha-beta plait domain superfamily [Helianthus annuus]|nr:putative RNA recognition motif domain, nucleotide-binding alpha-beta plait domain superfamily [Helianthus annuus]KAJ0436115.1 putative RNA recognition motif domain, nucleotide-binding alpha-beta plait domain superfamily [Helianthus annuus]KAJ0449468.1 putative RNA recognition motif domain, nucleotide-binding alpha-beta plait domain superfamily [Helianthus annuus]
MAEEQLDYGDEEFGGSQKTRYHGDGAIPALADDEIGGEDDEYDDLYNDVNVGENFLQMQRAESLPSVNIGNGKFHDQKPNFPEAQPEARPDSMVSQDKNIPGVAAETVYPTTGLNKEGLTVDLSQKRMVPEVSNDMGFHGTQKPSEPIPIGNEQAPMINSNPGNGPGGVPPMPGQQMGANQGRTPAENGATTLFVGELHWWTTDAELENVLSHYGRVKEIKFFDERASGKSKGYCQVDFYDSVSAAACKDGMNGYVFNGRPCVVAFASPQTIRQMGASYGNKNQGPVQSQADAPGRRPVNDVAGRGGGNNFSGGDAGRNYGRGNWGRGGGGQGVMNRGGGNMRGRGGMGPKNVNTPGFGTGGGYGGPAFGGPPGGFMPPQGMMGGGGGGMEGPQAGMWGDTGMGWGGEDHGQSQGQGQRTRESSYGGEDGGSEHGYGGGGEGSHEKVTTTRSNREKDREWSENSEKRHRGERDRDPKEHRDRYDKDYKYKEEKDSYRDRDHHRQKDRNAGYDDDWDRGAQGSTRSRSRSRAMPEDDRHHHRSRSRSRDADYGKRRRMRSD